MEIFEGSKTIFANRAEIAELIRDRDDVDIPRAGWLNIDGVRYVLVDNRTSCSMDIGPETWMNYLPKKEVDCEERVRESPGFDLKKFQHQVCQWAADNFPDEREWHLLLGAMEEVGELCHAYLKRDMGIRGTDAEHQMEMKDAIGDICVFVAQFCNRVGLDLESCIEDTWDSVRTRDWRKYPHNGRTE